MKASRQHLCSGRSISDSAFIIAILLHKKEQVARKILAACPSQDWLLTPTREHVVSKLRAAQQALHSLDVSVMRESSLAANPAGNP